MLRHGSLYRFLGSPRPRVVTDATQKAPFMPAQHQVSVPQKFTSGSKCQFTQPAAQTLLNDAAVDATISTMSLFACASWRTTPAESLYLFARPIALFFSSTDFRKGSNDLAIGDKYDFPCLDQRWVEIRCTGVGW